MNKYLIGLGLIIAAFFAGKYLTKPKTEIKEVIKTVTVEKYVEKRNVVKTTKTTKKTDGTEITETTESDRSVIVDNTSSRVEKKLEVKSGGKITLGLLAIKDTSDFSRPTEFGATVSVPLFGNVKAQALGTTDKKVGVGLALEF